MHCLHLDVEGLYRVFTIALVLFTYGLTATLGGADFLLSISWDSCSATVPFRE